MIVESGPPWDQGASTIAPPHPISYDASVVAAREQLLENALTVLRSEISAVGSPTTCVQPAYSSVEEARAHIVSILDVANQDWRTRFRYANYLDTMLSDQRRFLKRAAFRVLQDEGMIRIETAGRV